MSTPHARPTMAELRSRVHKQRHREIGNWAARRVWRPTAVYGTWLAVRAGASAHQVTTLALISTLASAFAIGTGTPAGFLIGVILVHLTFWLDHVDGQVARWNRSASLDGVFYDYLLHHVYFLTQGFALGQGLAMRTGDPLWSVAGFLIGAGWTVIGLTNDTRYKAFFQRLKSDNRIFRVESGSGGRPTPAPGWPRRGLGVLTWPLYKCCEAHVISAWMTVMALFLSYPWLWEASWKWGVRGMAAAAPVLASARAFRSIRRGVAESEFDRWFVPVPEGDPRDWTPIRGTDSL